MSLPPAPENQPWAAFQDHGVGWATIAVELEGPFIPDPRGALRHTGVSGTDAPDGSELTWLDLALGVDLPMEDGANWPSSFDWRTLGHDDGVRLGEVYGLAIYCKSRECSQAALRHRRAPPLVAKILMVWNGGGRYRSTFHRVMPDNARHESLSQRNSEFSIEDVPASLRCNRCRKVGRVLSATELTVNGKSV